MAEHSDRGIHNITQVLNDNTMLIKQGNIVKLLNGLRKDGNLVILPADKTKATVVMNI